MLEKNLPSKNSLLKNLNVKFSLPILISQAKGDLMKIQMESSDSSF